MKTFFDGQNQEWKNKGFWIANEGNTQNSIPQKEFFNPKCV